MNTPFPSPGRRRSSWCGPFDRSFQSGFHAPEPPHAQHGDEGDDHEHHEHHEHHGPGFGRGFGPGFNPAFGPRFGPGFGPGRPGFGPGFGPGFQPGFSRGFGPGRGGHEGRGRGRGRRGNIRAAVLALLVEEPRHGYAIMTELAERSGGLWRPSPGSVYPILQQLQDEGLVSVEESDGRRVFSLTDAGRSYVAEHPEEVREPWHVEEGGPRQRAQSIMFAVQALGVAADQVARLADEVQSERAVLALEEARRALYRILAGDDTSETPAGPPA